MPRDTKHTTSLEYALPDARETTSELQDLYTVIDHQAERIEVLEELLEGLIKERRH
jgi:hypothetical protein